MAVIKGVKVAIQVGGRGLQEYDVNETKPNSTVKYVQASTGAAFKIKLGVPKSFAFAGNALSFKVSVDGAYVDGLLCRKKKICTKAFDYVCEGSPNKDRGRWQLRPFVFQEIKQGKHTLY